MEHIRKELLSHSQKPAILKLHLVDISVVKDIAMEAKECHERQGKQVDAQCNNEVRSECWRGEAL